MLADVRGALVRQYHQCVPLGWNPVPVEAHYYVSGRSVEGSQEGVWLKSLWIGFIARRDLAVRPAKPIVRVLDALTRQGLISRTPTSRGDLYRLTFKAVPFFYTDNAYNDNRDGLPYLCYSTIVPQSVLWVQRPHFERSSDGKPWKTFRAAIAWSPGAPAPWASDAVLRAHSVVLSPVRSPVVAKFVREDGAWQLVRLYDRTPELPRLVDASAWR